MKKLLFLLSLLFAIAAPISVNAQKIILKKFTPNESDYQLKIRQDILDYLEEEKNLTVSVSYGDAVFFSFEEEGVTYKLAFELPFKDDPKIVFVNFYIFSEYNNKYDPRVYAYAKQRMDNFRTIKSLYNNDKKYFVISTEMYIANPENFNDIFDKVKDLLRYLYIKILPEECERAQYDLRRMSR